MADIVARLRLAHQNNVQSFPGSTIFAEAAEEIERLRKALQSSDTALKDWLHTYAPDECEPETVRATWKRIWDHGGTIGYVADVTAEIRAALTEGKEGGGE